MIRMEKRTTIALSKEDMRQMKYLEKTLGESQSTIFKRGLALLYKTTKDDLVKPTKLAQYE